LVEYGAYENRGGFTHQYDPECVWQVASIRHPEGLGVDERLAVERQVGAHLELVAPVHAEPVFGDGQEAGRCRHRDDLDDGGAVGRLEQDRADHHRVLSLVVKIVLLLQAHHHVRAELVPVHNLVLVRVHLVEQKGHVLLKTIT
jgi:hypothetical protein